MGLTAARERRWLITILSLYVALGISYSLLMPIWEAPDEPAHYHLAWHLARRGEYPTPQHNYEAHQPRLYYYAAAMVLRALGRLDTDYTQYVLPLEHKANFKVPERRFDWTTENYRFLPGVYLLRWINLVIGALALWVNWRAMRLVVPDEPGLRLSAFALAGLTPQFPHITSSVNNDTLGVLAGAIVYYLALRVLDGSSERFAWAALAAAVLLPLATKLTVLPLSVALMAVVIWRHWSTPAGRKVLAFSALVVLGAALLGFWFSPVSLRSAADELAWRLFTLRSGALTWDYLRFIVTQITWSYWGKVGWLAVGLPGWMVATLAGLGGLSALLNARLLRREGALTGSRRLWALTWLAAALTVAAVFRNGLTTSASQGRFLFPAIGALSLLMVSGWYALLPPHIRSRLHWIVLGLMLLCNLVVIKFAILPTYFQPFLD